MLVETVDSVIICILSLFMMLVYKYSMFCFLLFFLCVEM